MAGPTMRDCCLTLYSEYWLGVFITGELVLPDGFTYFCGQVEVCPQSGRLHVQAYGILEKPYRLATVKRKLCDATAHIEKRHSHSTRSEARAYTWKEESAVTPWVEAGVFVELRQGYRSDLQDVYLRMLNGETLSSLFRDEDTFPVAVRYPRGLSLAEQAMQQAPPRPEQDVLALWGPPGTGKTHSVFERWTEGGIYKLIPPAVHGGQVWWDGYDAQETVLLDDYEGWLPWTYLLQLLDVYPMWVQPKGRMVPLRCRRVVITSNKEPKDWHPRQDTNLAALTRRLHWIWHCGAMNNWTLTKGTRPSCAPPMQLNAY